MLKGIKKEYVKNNLASPGVQNPINHNKPPIIKDKQELITNSIKYE